MNMIRHLLLLILLIVIAAPSIGAQPEDRPGPRHDGPSPHHAADRGDRVGPRDRDHHDRPHRDKLRREEVEAAIEIIERFDPDTAAKLQERYQEDPRKAGRALVERFPRIRMFLRLREFDPAMFELRVDQIRLARLTMSVAGEYQRAWEQDDTEAIATAEARLRDLLAERFELSQRIREREIAGLEDQLLVLREQLEEQADRKDMEIQQQFERITRQCEDDRSPDARGGDEKAQGVQPGDVPRGEEARYTIENVPRD